MIASEIDGIARFVAPAKLCAYAGVVPTTHASGGRVYQGRLLWQCNKWLRWALVEASWSAIQFSGYFGGIYRAARDRGKKQERRHHSSRPSPVQNHLAVAHRKTALH